MEANRNTAMQRGAEGRRVSGLDWVAVRLFRTNRTPLPSMPNAFHPRKQKARRIGQAWVYVGHMERENRA